MVVDEAGTKVVFTHTGLPDEDEMKAQKAGWADFVFTPLEDYIMVTNID